MKKKSLFIGRFQPFHIGHLADIKNIIASGEHCIIAIAAANKSGTFENPLTGDERLKILSETLIEEKDLNSKDYEIHLLTDIDNDEKWVQHVVDHLPPFEKIYSGSSYVREFFIKDGRFPAYPVKMILENNGENLCATNIRKKNLKWEDYANYLPSKTRKMLATLAFGERLTKITAKMTNKKIKVNPNIFRAYDIRGKAMLEDGSTDSEKVDLSPESVYLITRGIATYMRRKLNIPHGDMLHTVVGRDCRLTGPALLNAMIKALLDTNCRVANIDLSTSPMVYYATCKYGFDMGLVLTASHNHKNDNGIKIVEKNAHSVCGPELEEILKLVQSEDFEIFHEDMVGFASLPCKASFAPCMIGESYALETVFDDYMKDLTEKLPLAKAERPPRVAVDAGNGVVGKFIGPLLRAAGCEVVKLYCDLDGNYPNHEANPEYEENLTDLMLAVKNQKCDMGFGFDGDGDRVGVVDENGKYVNADKLIILLARDILSRNPKGKIVFDVKCSTLVKKEIEKAGGLPIVERTGHSFIENRMRAEGAHLAGEVSGHIFIAEDYYGFDDGMFAALKMVKILNDKKSQNSETNFSDLLADLPQMFTTPEIKIPCPDDKKFDIVEMVAAHFCRDHECLKIDGVKILFSETRWGLVRASNTSAYLTLRFEADSAEELKNIQILVGEHLENYPELDLSRLKQIS